jgi:hypothetical protein
MYNKYNFCWRIRLDGPGPHAWLGPSNMSQTRSYPAMVAVKDKVYLIENETFLIFEIRITLHNFQA